MPAAVTAFAQDPESSRWPKPYAGVVLHPFARQGVAVGLRLLLELLVEAEQTQEAYTIVVVQSKAFDTRASFWIEQHPMQLVISAGCFDMYVTILSGQLALYIRGVVQKSASRLCEHGILVGVFVDTGIPDADIQCVIVM